MRRKEGTLIPIEITILETGIGLAMGGQPQFHGFHLAKEIKDREDAKLLTAHGTLYKALDRLQRWGFLESEWEDPSVAAYEGRPRRKFYWVTTAGQAALVQAFEAQPERAAVRRNPGMATS
jgi:DNA-binding PadR family transcriptional regulator